VVVGAGFSGLYQLFCLREKLGLNVKVLESGAGVGGTWFWNQYPGARCDSESHSYMYYFSKELIDAWQWSERFPAQPDVLRYLNFVADKFDLRRNILLNTRLKTAEFIESKSLWHLCTENNEEFEATYLITAVGCLSSANIPRIEGLDSFKGRYYHTGQWPKEGVDFTDKRVGVIGTGSTGIQVIPVVASQAKHLTVFQRTANYSIPARNAPLTEDFKLYVKKNSEQIHHIMNSNTNCHPFRMQERNAIDTPEVDREQLYEQAWNKGGLQFRASFKDLLSNEKSNATAADFIIRKIRSIVRDPIKAKILTNIDHPFAGKRPPIDTHYFETFNQSHVEVVDLRADPIKHISENAVCTQRNKFPLDIIVFATGYDAMTGSLLKIDIRGRSGISLKDQWKNGPINYLGLQVPQFPNLFTITGPGSPSVLCNMPPAIEQHVNWITECIKQLRQKNKKTIEPLTDASERWIATVNEAASASLLGRVKHSWYFGANVPGKPQVFMPYAGGFDKYALICEQVKVNNYEGFFIV
jgi:cation diffusion facilitator CzcD-associated flavoprotein CzcO